MALEIEFAAELKNRLDEIEANAVATLPNGLPYDQYQQSCGFLEAIRQVRDSVIPDILEALQRR
jgi:hypothetical protein